MGKKSFPIAKWKESCAERSGALLAPSLSPSVSLQIFLVQVFSQAALNRACLPFVFLQKDVFANFKPDLQSLKAEVASDAHRFRWILFFPPWHACFQK